MIEPTTMANHDATSSLEYIPCLSTLPCSGYNPIVVHIPGANDQFIDTQSIVLSVTARVVAEDNKPLLTKYSDYAAWLKLTSSEDPSGSAKLGSATIKQFVESCPIPSNLFLFTMFKDVEVQLSNTTVFNAGGRYAYLAYLDALTNFSDSAKQSHLT
jgi:hypothetical protein